MTENIIIKPSVQKRFDSFMAHGRVLFFSAPCGFGKTVLADALLRGQVQRRNRADYGCEAADREDPRQPHPRQAEREAPGGGQDRREKAAAHSG